MAEHAKDPTTWNHANPILEVADLRRAITFYRDVLGLVPNWVWEDQAAGIAAEEAPIEIYFARVERPSPSRLAVFVDDADAAYARYRAAGADTLGGPETMPWGLRGFTVRDPDGNLIGFWHEVGAPVGRPEFQELS